MGSEDDQHHGGFATKTEPTYYTRERVAAARRNVERHEWARERRDDAVERADDIIERHGSLDDLWRFPTAQTVPRSSSVSAVGSPITGERLYEEFGRNGWLDWTDPPDAFDGVDATRPDTPWEVVDPTTGCVFPTNDFAAYYESGLDERHGFDPDLADDSLLVNERCPDRPDDWGVDDGTGWTDGDGTTYFFAAYCNRYNVWGELRRAVDTFREAYLYDGDPRYARAATVLLDRIADLYPEMDISVFPRGDGYHRSDGGSGQGKAVGCISETGLTTDLVGAYDAVFAGQDDGELVEFLAARAARYGLGEKSSVGAIRENIERGIVRQVLPGVREGKIRGNFGHHQTSLAMSAAVIDEPDGYTDEALDFLFRSGEYVRGDDGRGHTDVITGITGGRVLERLVDDVDRDGHAHESPDYNRGIQRSLHEIADILSTYGVESERDLFSHPKFRKFLESLIHLNACNRFVPHVGDTHNTGDPGLRVNRRAMLDAFEEYGDPIYAQAAVLDNGESTDGLVRDVFADDPEGLAERIERVVDADGPLDLPSETLAGYGFSALRHGSVGGTDDAPASEATRQRMLWLYYGRNASEVSRSGHHHRDTLSLGVFAHGLNLTPDLGYPERTLDWPKKLNWTTNTVSHNTVVVDAERQRPQWVGEPRRVGRGQNVDVVDVAAPRAYPQTDRYRRTAAFVGVDAERSYAVDFFRVAGGDDHLFSFHGPEGDVETEGLELTAQDGGTYAGTNVPFPSYGERTAYDEDAGNGFNHLRDVERDGSPPASFSVDWDATDTWDVLDRDRDVHLRLTMLADCDEIALAEGEPPRKPGNPEAFTYLLARRRGTGLESAFVSVVEPYVDEAPIRSVEPATVEALDGDATDARAVRVELKNGRVDVVVSTLDADAEYLVDGRIRFSGAVGVYAERDGEPAFARVEDGTLLDPDAADGPLVERSRPRAAGTVVDYTRELGRDNELVLDVDDPGRLVAAVERGDAEWVVADVEGDQNGAYRIVDAAAVGGGHVVVDVGDVTTVEAYVDPERPAAGYEYVVDEGDRVTVPFTTTWRGE